MINVYENNVYSLPPDEYLWWMNKAKDIFDFRKSISELDNVFKNTNKYYYQQENFFLYKEGLYIIRKLCDLSGEKRFVSISNEMFDFLRLGGTNAYSIPCNVNDDYYDKGRYYLRTKTGDNYFDIFDHIIFDASGEWGVVGSSSAEISILAIDREIPYELDVFFKKELFDVQEMVSITWEGMQSWMKRRLYSNYVR